MKDQPNVRSTSIASNGSEPHDIHPPVSARTEPSMLQSTLIPNQLAETAAAGDIDPCDLAESAMPDLVIGDLAPPDEAWVRTHTLTCAYCANILHSFEDVCATLDESDALFASRQTSVSSPPIASRLGLANLRYGFMDSPVGDILLGVSEEGVAEISYLAENDLYDTLRELETRGFLVYERQDAVNPVADQIQAYFEHQRQDFAIPVDLTGVTDFTKRVLHSAERIPYGKVWTYGDVARAIGQPKASRAVGNALGRNPIPVVIPCHRVILSSGAMGWYTGGPEIKRKLLGIEGVTWAHESQASLALDT